jgi:hypothetical protein
MSDPPPPDLIASTMEALTPYAEVLPPLTAKYLVRPPIKYLVLVVAGFHKLNGFASGIFTPEQLSGELPDRQDKLEFFAVLREYVQRITNQTVDVSAKSIITGHEVAKTLVFLQQIVNAVEHPVHRFDSIRRRGANESGRRSDVEKLREILEKQKMEIERLREGNRCVENRFSFAMVVPRPSHGGWPRTVVKFVPTHDD